jgi:hypothetical protein
MFEGCMQEVIKLETALFPCSSSLRRAGAMP